MLLETKLSYKLYIIYKKNCWYIKMKNLSISELRLIIKERNIDGYKNMP